MRHALLVLLAIATTVAAALPTAPAHACGACSCPGGDVRDTTVAFVWTGESGLDSVPTDVRIFVWGPGADPILETADGTPVSAHVELSGAPDGVFIVPDSPLAPATSFIVRSRGEAIHGFETGVGPLEADPPILVPPTPTDARGAGFYCGRTVGLPLEIPNGMFGGLLRVDVEDDTHSATRFISASPDHLALLRPFSLGPTSDVTCGGHLGIDFLVAGETYVVRVSRVDAIGRTSEPVVFSHTALLLTPASCGDEGGCAIARGTRTDGAPPTILALAVLVLMTRRQIR